MTESLPAAAVVRFSGGSFDPSRFAEIDAANANLGNSDWSVGVEGDKGKVQPTCEDVSV